MALIVLTTRPWPLQFVKVLRVIIAAVSMARHSHKPR